VSHVAGTKGSPDLHEKENLDAMQEFNFNPRDVLIQKDNELGRSAFSVVYSGTLSGRTEVAVKVIRMAHEDDLTSVEDEIRRANLAHHRNVVHVFGIVKEPDGVGSVGVVMERLGVSLHKALELGQVTQAFKRMKFTLDIIAGMVHLHNLEHGGVRFGINPADILLTQDGDSAKMVDFGVAMTVSALAPVSTTSIRFSLRFSAPELFADDDWEPSSACDVYSFAVILAELWTGTIAWEGTSEGLIPAAVMEGKRPFFQEDLLAKGVPAPIIGVITTCWAQDPSHRPSSTKLGELRNVDQT
jgi:serine/threonine protein kinase